MARKAIGAILVGVALCLLITACGQQTTPADFVDTWTEPDEKPAHIMRIEPARDGVFHVIYPRFYPAGGDFQFTDGELTYSAISPELVDVIVYHSDSDTITITGGSGHSYTLYRRTP